MAPEDTRSKKRKVASESAPKPKKQKQSDGPAPATKKSAKAPKAATKTVDEIPVDVTNSRKRAEDFFSDDDVPATAKAVKEKKGKKKGKAIAEANGTAKDATEAAGDAPAPKEKSKKRAKKDEPVEEVEEAPVAPLKEASKKSKKEKAAKKQPIKEATPEDEDSQDEDEQLDEDDQTAALLAGFESDRDESDLEKEDERFDDAAQPQITKAQRLALEKAAKRDEPGVLFLGRIPHGFYEPQMKRYFAQFGKVTKLRLSRNKKTGASKHYAFIEFKSTEVAEIVAKTMDNYLMFGRILQCKSIPPDQVHPDLFKGANERFSKDPRNKKAGLEMERGAERAVWEKRVEKESKRRTKASQKLKEDFDYTFEVPALKTVDGVSKAAVTLENGDVQQLLTEAPTEEVTEPVKAKKSKKGSKGKADATIEPVTIPEPVEEVQEKPAKKGRKRKSDIVDAPKEEDKEEQQATPVKAKRAKRVSAAAEEVAEETPKKKKQRGNAADEEPAKAKKTKKAKA